MSFVELSKLLFVVFMLLICFAGVRSEAQRLPGEEIEALKKIATKLRVKQWDFNVEPCSGKGGWTSVKSNTVLSNVTCNCSHGISSGCHIQSIALTGQNLTGVLPEEFADLKFLEQINLSLNYINGTIPAKWALLPLTYLSLSGNRISGTIPHEVGKITTLESLVLEDNLLDGPLPQEIGNLPNLQDLLLSGNQFSGTLPNTFAMLTNLKTFSISGNDISGRIPDFIGRWTKIQTLKMLGTSLMGPIPSRISMLTNLTDLRISDLKGPNIGFPPLQNMKLIRKVVLRNCSISGQIPLYIASVMGSLCVLDLSFNSLTGKIPSNFDDLQSLKYLYLNNNKLTGEVPSWVFLTPTNIDISNNDFTGSSQQSSCQIGNVNFAASYSSTNGKLTAACLKKNLPCSGKPQYYSLFINCGGSKLIADRHEYEEDSSPVGPSTFFTTGRWASSSTGHCMDNPMATFIATNTSALNNANPNLYSTARTAPISLKYYGLCLLNGIYTVSLHFAEIIFTADQTFSGIGRRVFDVSVQGVRVLKDFNIENRAGGPGRALVLNFTAKVISNTLEIHLYWAGKGTTSVPYKGVYGPLISAISVTPSFVPHIRRRHKVPIGAIIGITVAASAAALLVSLFLWVKRFFEGTILADEELKSMQLKTGYFSLKDIKAATDNFSSANKIGEGGFGPVYKGKLPDGSVIAIKQLSSKSKQGDREFLTEIGMISALQHPNLVKLYGCCAEGNQLMVIYEYMENNCLARALFGSVERRLSLNWETRYKICKGIAKGLAYLHEESRLKIVHRDIKATNVLLDADLNAKISDFGLAKLAEDESTHISTRIAGTRGYMAPEYAMRGHLTSKADVYSFGVVLLEIVSGRSNTNYRNDDKFAHLLDWAIALEKEGKLLELVDPGLKSSYSAEEATRVLQLALLCTNTSPNLRPSMSTVVSMLEGKVAVRVLLEECGSFGEDSQKHSTVMDGPSLDSSASRKKSFSTPSTSDLA